MTVLVKVRVLVSRLVDAVAFRVDVRLEARSVAGPSVDDPRGGSDTVVKGLSESLGTRRDGARRRGTRDLHPGAPPVRHGDARAALEVGDASALAAAEQAPKARGEMREEENDETELHEAVDAWAAQGCFDVTSNSESLGDDFFFRRSIHPSRP